MTVQSVLQLPQASLRSYLPLFSHPSSTIPLQLLSLPSHTSVVGVQSGWHCQPATPWTRVSPTLQTAASLSRVIAPWTIMVPDTELALAESAIPLRIA